MKTDHQLKEDITNELTYEPSVNESHIGVTAQGGVVTLSGHVPSTLPSRIRGITNAIEVKPAVSAGDVKAKIEAAFRRSAEIDSSRIQVETRDGKVKLRGKVHSWFESTEALNAAWSAPGVITVENELVIAP
jgi:osmotically-inducible protein OsmY